ncbi:unnamed protein product [Brassica rapa subsp. narinosa]
MFNVVFLFLCCMFYIYLLFLKLYIMFFCYFGIFLILKCKTIFNATCHLSGEIFSADVDTLWSLKSSLLLVEIC